jgi:hypothetical protein
MRLFWGLIETTPAPAPCNTYNAPEHHHTFDPTKWVITETLEQYSYNAMLQRNFPTGNIVIKANTCLECGELFEKRFDHTVKQIGDLSDLMA